MKINTSYRYFIVILCLYSIFSFSQQNETYIIPDSLKNKTYQELYDDCYLVANDTVKSLIYLNTYLQKSKDEKNVIETAKAYSFLASYQREEEEKLKLIDTAIYLSKDKSHDYYPTVAYSFKGGHHYEKGEYKKALDAYLHALSSAYEMNNTEYIYITKHNIGRLKSRTGDYDEALVILKECFKYEESKKPIDERGFLKSVLLLSETYTKNKQLDSSSYFINKGIGLSKKVNDNIYNRFILNEGINLFHKQRFNEANDSIYKSLSKISKLEDKSFLITAYFYMGKINMIQDDVDKANVNFKKVDSVYNVISYPSPIVRETYEHFVKYYKLQEDISNQLAYIEKILKFDSISNISNNYLKERIIKEYDTPELLNEKEKIIDSLESKNKNSFLLTSILIGVSSLTIILLFLNYRKRKIYQKRFEELLQAKETRKETPVDLEKIEKTNSSIKIAQEIIDKILESLQSFEQKKGFLKSDITTNSLAKEFSTNSKYLSKIVNSYKQKSFSNYINDLRIDHAVDKLRSDNKFRNYTIKAISKDIGFNTTEAFSKSFHKKTGLYPSYFIKKLVEHNK
ncbi:AraC family transcriptional regulator [Aquimarina sp. 2201CG14-23]|uniref:AraC family transcriptional regulator n=1 Tax=Aquimarina mycalae TaxID=3040073 RepID=UPI002477CF17|nr:AraC family transcriptional regulator [Aquimarina sp. 2201CG14-23]MDH7446087.1 AraC family transcriptional regulator [Aquimarina sp. 2201CG14-23]